MVLVRGCAAQLLLAGRLPFFRSAEGFGVVGPPVAAEACPSEGEQSNLTVHRRGGGGVGSSSAELGGGSAVVLARGCAAQFLLVGCLPLFRSAEGAGVVAPPIG